jgi:putative ABC transport system permease protein
MFNLTIWQEILTTMGRNKLRTFLTGFAIAWGIFMLIILLASGNGLKNGVNSNFENIDLNVVSLWVGRTSVPYKGYQTGRSYKFNDTDVKLIQQLEEVEKVFPDFSTWLQVCYSSESAYFRIAGAFPESLRTGNIKLLAGRFINALDLEQKRKVIIIDEKLKHTFFKNQDPIDKYISLNGINFKIIGIQKRGNNNEGSLYIPFTTAKTLFNNNDYWSLSFTTKNVNNKADAKKLETAVRTIVAAHHEFDPEDKSAMYAWSTIENFEETQSIFGAISLFVWIIGLGTLMAGIVGVSNIMVITIKDRTKEFGIRKALGATPYSIIKLIMLESLLITLVFGYIGMSLGILLTEGASSLLASMNQGSEFVFFRDPTVDLRIAASATFLLIAAGLLAGYIPARKAVKIKPIEAIRHE